MNLDPFLIHSFCLPLLRPIQETSNFPGILDFVIDCNMPHGIRKPMLYPLSYGSKACLIQPRYYLTFGGPHRT
jgi:hypothetical protein